MSNILITYYDLFCKDDNEKIWNSEYRLLDKNDKNIDCPITLDKINENDKYCKCSNCNYNFNYESLIIHLDIKNDCPMCRYKWQNNKIYTNSKKEIKKDYYMFKKLSNIKKKVKIIVK